VGKVTTGATMSLDGYIAGPAESGFDLLFQWYENGPIDVPTAQAERTFHMTPENADIWRALMDRTGALIVGRHLFDLTSGWDGKHPIGTPVVVLTHHPPTDFDSPDFTFVTGGIEEAVDTAQRLAGGKEVGVNGGTIARQCLDAGLLDEVWISLVPVLLGGGTPFFERLSNAPVALDGPVSVVQGTGVTHLAYRVRR
jgi:dihydrofolate reductase